jgi:hypothetical protein
MVRRVTPSQYKSMVRQAEAKRRDAIRKFNNAVSEYNRGVKKVVDNYNREVRAHNARVRADRQRLSTAVNRLNSQSSTPSRVRYTVQSSTVYHSYQRLESRAEEGVYSGAFNSVLDLAEREAANSAELENSLAQEPTDTGVEPQVDADPEVVQNLAKVEADLGDRWRGALFALSPRNPDAARHFCTSAREIYVRILDAAAPDSDLRASELCELTNDGRISRRSKIQFMLSRQGLSDGALQEFVEDDVENILQLFRVFNEGTHGSVGKFGASQLGLIKKRVEDGLKFLTAIF